MALTITSVVTTGGPGCRHLRVTLDVEGAPLIFEVNQDELDIENGPPPFNITTKPGGMPDGRAIAICVLATTWARYRRRLGRTVTGVAFA